MRVDLDKLKLHIYDLVAVRQHQKACWLAVKCELSFFFNLWTLILCSTDVCFILCSNNKKRIPVLRIKKKNLSFNCTYFGECTSETVGFSPWKVKNHCIKFKWVSQSINLLIFGGEAGCGHTLFWAPDNHRVQTWIEKQPHIQIYGALSDVLVILIWIFFFWMWEEPKLQLKWWTLVMKHN